MTPRQANTPPESAAPRPGRRARHRLLSPLTWRILAVNVLALAILVGGLFYVGQYRDSLVEAKVSALRTDGAIIAGALGEGAVGGPPEDIALHVEVATDFVRRLALLTGTRVRLYDEGGVLIADSRILTGGAREVRGRPLAPEDEAGGMERLAGWLTDLFDRLFSYRTGLPLYVERAASTAADFPEVGRALEGEPASRILRTAEDEVVVAVAVPVQRFKKVLGALLLTARGDDVESGVREVRVAILEVFLLALAITVLLSLYLATTIVRPLHRLAQVAEQVRRAPMRRTEIPDFTRRRDEIGELSGALRAMTAALFDRIEAIEHFAADVAHEVRNPITSIRSAVELLARGGDEARTARLIAIVIDDVARLDRLIGDIADASRLDAEMAREQTVPVDLVALVGALAEVHRATATPDTPRIDVDAGSGGEILVEGIESRLGQVMRNLLSNAITFSPPGGRIQIRLSRDGATARITVEDDGPGIPEDNREAIFERFYTARPEGEDFGTHSGLGLNISRQIVVAFGGTIRAENRRDAAGRVSGARLIVELPVAA
jgi:two-component system sensor histidine kinase ChvG